MKPMPAPLDVPALLAQGMGLHLHWFPEDVSLTQLAPALAGMANGAGGLVLIGVAPRSRQVHGVRQPQEILDRIFQACLALEPVLVIPLPAIVPVSQMQVVCLQVPAGLPHVYSLEGRYWQREGSQTNPIPPRRLRQLLMTRGVVQFESQVPPGATFADLDAIQVQAYLSAIGAAGSDPQEVLLRRGCLQKVEAELRPTNAALLLFGRSPQRWMPGAAILAARFTGLSYADQFIKQEISGTLPQQLSQAEAFLRTNLRSVVRLVGLVHQETLEYPYEAVRELLVNAVAHRDYNIQGDPIHLHLFADRLEVHSPGGLPGPITLDNLLEARFSRNPVIMQVLSDLGYVERLGYGLDRVVAVMRQNQLRPPTFMEMANTFRVILYNHLSAEAQAGPLVDLSPYGKMDLNDRQMTALSYLVQRNRITNRDYQELCPEVHAETLRRDLADLVSRGILLKIGNKRATYYIFKKNPLNKKG